MKAGYASYESNPEGSQKFRNNIGKKNREMPKNNTKTIAFQKFLAEIVYEWNVEETILSLRRIEFVFPLLSQSFHYLYLCTFVYR